MTNDTQKSIHWTELDVLRGLAALMMILNHLGYKTLAPNLVERGLAGSLLFISSLAPVLFFFVTGVGYGIQSSRKKKTSPWYGILNKFIILVLADFLMHWSEGRWLGLDFLGFIAFSSLVLEFIRRSKYPVTYCVVGFILISLMRYLLEPLILSLGNEPQTWGILNWILGTKDTPGVSYPLSPWMAYPFAGYIIGVAAMRYRGFIETHRWRVVSGLLLLGGLKSVAGLILITTWSVLLSLGNSGYRVLCREFCRDFDQSCRGIGNVWRTQVKSLPRRFIAEGYCFIGSRSRTLLPDLFGGYSKSNGGGLVWV